jgi:MFS transporter, ACDE family, multidrug resistance protein
MNTSTAQSGQKNPNSIFQDKNFYVINLLTVMTIMGATIYNPAIPAIQRHFNVSQEQVAWVSTIFQIPGAIITPIFGILADYFGRKQILVPSLLAFALGGVMSGFAENFSSLIGWRLLQGIGTSSLEPLQLTLIGDLYRGRKLGTVMALNAALIGITSAFFPLIGGILGQFDWRYTFMPSVLAVLVSIFVITILALPKQQTRPQNFQLKEYLRNALTSVNNHQVIGLLFAIMSFFMLQVGTCLIFIPIFASDLFQTSTIMNGILLTSMSLSLALIAPQLGVLNRKFSEIQLIKIAFVIFSLALFLIPFTPSFWLLFVPMFLLGAAQGLAFPCIQGLLGGLAADESRGAFMSVNSTIQSWGQTLGPLLGGLIIMRWGIKAVFLLSGLYGIIALVIFHLLLRTKKPRTVTPRIRTEVSTLAVEQATILQAEESVTSLQTVVPLLIHTQTNRVIKFPEQFEIINIGKHSDRINPDVDLADYPHANIVSRLHAQIRFDGTSYYIQDMGSSNGTYINKYPMLPGTWYKLKSGLTFSLGKQNLVSFVFQES